MKDDDYVPPAPAVLHNLMRDTAWRNQLRRSVSLYLALGSQPANAPELELTLLRTEEELVQYLLQGERPTAQAITYAQRVLDGAQHALLQSADEVQQLLQTLSAEQALFYATKTVALPPTPSLPRGAAR